MLDRAFTFMGHARNEIGLQRERDTDVVDLVFPGDPFSVRHAIASALASIRGAGVGEPCAGIAEIVLAEVLNNIVEHAYASEARGVIELRATRAPGELAFLVLDDGQPMPHEILPTDRKPDLNKSVEDMPEGGFGWPLIHELTTQLVYTRSGSRNELRFRIPLGALLNRN